MLRVTHVILVRVIFQVCHEGLLRENSTPRGKSVTPRQGGNLIKIDHSPAGSDRKIASSSKPDTSAFPRHVCFKQRLRTPYVNVISHHHGLVMAIKRRPSFNSASFLAKVGKGRSTRKYRKGQVVFSQGDAGDAVFYVQKGKVKVTVVSEQGKEAVVAILGTDEFFGEGCLAGQALRISTVTTMMDSVIARIEKAVIIRVIHREPTFAEMFITHLLGRNIRVEADLVDQLFNSSEKRLARMLLLLANFGKESKPEPVIAKISQETLAEMIGTTRSRVSFFMNKFRELGFIDYNGSGLEVHASLLNAVLHDQPQIKT